LTLSGSDTVAHYQAALRGVKYRNTSGNLNGAMRTVTFEVSDGGAASNLVSRNITIANDAGQWAGSVIAFSSQYSSGPWSAAKALGVPDVLAYGDNTKAWCPQVRNGTTEFVTLGYGTPIHAEGVLVRETLGNGFVTNVEVRNVLTGTFESVWSGVDPSVPGAVANFVVSFPRTGYLVDAVRVSVDTSHSTNWEEIDAVQLRGSSVSPLEIELGSVNASDSRVVNAEEMQAAAGSPAAGRIDLLTVVVHELGHVLGFADVDPPSVGGDVMSGRLGPGVRRMPSGLLSVVSEGIPDRVREAGVRTWAPDPRSFAVDGVVGELAASCSPAAADGLGEVGGPSASVLREFGRSGNVLLESVTGSAGGLGTSGPSGVTALEVKTDRQVGMIAERKVRSRESDEFFRELDVSFRQACKTFGGGATVAAGN